MSNNLLLKLKTFFIESRQELKQVQWPTRRDAVRLTAIVIAMSLALAVFLGAFDYFFSYILRLFVSQV
jgi:preprotein translocase subunit SecE